MKVEIHEHGNQFTVELSPENEKDVNILARFAAGSRKGTAKVETTFYSDGTTIGYVTTKKHQRKAFGTIK